MSIYFRQELKESRDENRNLKEQIKNIQENSHSQQQLTDAEITTLKSLALQQNISSATQTIVKSVVTGSEEPHFKFLRKTFARLLGKKSEVLTDGNFMLIKQNLGSLKGQLSFS